MGSRLSALDTIRGRALTERAENCIGETGNVLLDNNHRRVSESRSFACVQSYKQQPLCAALKVMSVVRATAREFPASAVRHSATIFFSRAFSLLRHFISDNCDRPMPPNRLRQVKKLRRSCRRCDGQMQHRYHQKASARSHAAALRCLRPNVASSPLRPSSTIRIFFAAVYCWRVARRMSLTAFS